MQQQPVMSTHFFYRVVRWGHKPHDAEGPIIGSLIGCEHRHATADEAEVCPDSKINKVVRRDEDTRTGKVVDRWVYKNKKGDWMYGWGAE